jgi:uncharacterized membrane protein
LESGEDVECRGREEDFVTLFEVGFVGVGGGIAVVLFFEFLGARRAAHEVPSHHCFGVALYCCCLLLSIAGLLLYRLLLLGWFEAQVRPG